MKGAGKPRGGRRLRVGVGLVWFGFVVHGEVLWSESRSAYVARWLRSRTMIF
jgi:hypothetical protein